MSKKPAKKRNSDSSTAVKKLITVSMFAISVQKVSLMYVQFAEAREVKEWFVNIKLFCIAERVVL